MEPNQVENGQVEQMVNDQTPPVSPTPAMASPTPPKRSKKWWVVLIIVIIIVAIGGGYYYWNWNNQETRNKLQTNSNDQTSKDETVVPTADSGQTTTSSTETPATTDKTADWKTYTNTDFNFSIQYPADWENKILQSDPSGTLQVAFKPNDKNKTYIGSPSILFTAAKVGDASGAIREGDCSQYNEPISKVTFGDEKVIKTLMSCENGDILVYYGEISKNKIGYAASGVQSGDDSVLQTFDQILSTFQFTSK